MSTKRVLIVRLSAIGDVVHTLPALAALRRAMPQSHIAWIVESLSASLLERHPLIDELIVYPRDRWRRRGYWRSVFSDIPAFFRQLRRRRFDVAVDFQGLTKSALIPRLSAIPVRIGFGGEDGGEISQWFYTARVKPPDEIRHVVHRNLHLLTALGVTAPTVEFPLPDLSAERVRVDHLLEQQGIGPSQRLVFLNPGAGWETKRWPPESHGRLAALIVRQLGRGVLITWGPGEENLVEAALAAQTAVLNSAPSTPRPSASGGRAAENSKVTVHRAPPTTLREFAAMLDHCCVMVGGDTGPVHLAAARGVPVVGLYGGSDPNRNGPLGPGKVQILTAPDVACHPCWKVRCDNPPPRCMSLITPEAVLEAVRATLSNAPPTN